MELAFVLVEPARPEHVGIAARAIKALTGGELRLVGTEAHLDQRAEWAAHGASDVLRAAQVFDNLERAVADLSLLIGTTARRRGFTKRYYRARELTELLASKSGGVERVGLLFGPEERGLRNSELRRCDVLSTVALRQEYPSLNLGQAVTVYAYELSGTTYLRRPGDTRPGAGTQRVLNSQVETLLARLQIEPDTPLYRSVCERTAVLNDDDTELLLGVLNKLLARLPPE